MEKLQLREEILSRMELPVIADRRYSVQEFGAVPDSVSRVEDALYSRQVLI